MDDQVPCASCGSELQRCMPNCLVEHNLLMGIEAIERKHQEEIAERKRLAASRFEGYFEAPVEMDPFLRVRVLRAYENGDAFSLLNHLGDIVGEIDVEISASRHNLPEMSVAREPDIELALEKAIQAVDDTSYLLQHLQKAVGILRDQVPKRMARLKTQRGEKKLEAINLMKRHPSGLTKRFAASRLTISPQQTSVLFNDLRSAGIADETSDGRWYLLSANPVLNLIGRRQLVDKPKGTALG